MVKKGIAGALLVAGAAVWRIFGWPADLGWVDTLLMYVVGIVLLVTYFAEGPRRRQLIGAPVILAVLLLPRAISWLMHR